MTKTTTRRPCEAIKANGQPCGGHVVLGAPTPRCAQHAEVTPAEQCRGRRVDGERCGARRVGTSRYCTVHKVAGERRRVFCACDAYARLHAPGVARCPHRLRPPRRATSAGLVRATKVALRDPEDRA